MLLTSATLLAGRIGMSIISRILFCLLVFGSPAFGQGGSATKAWWLTAVFPATSESYMSLGASEIEPDFSRITALSFEILPPGPLGSSHRLPRPV